MESHRLKPGRLSRFGIEHILRGDVSARFQTSFVESQRPSTTEGETNRMAKSTYLFSVSTGRSGSKYLCNLLRHAEDCCSRHEPQPTMSGRPMYEYLRGNPEPLAELMPKKIRAIEAARGERRVYSETNHCFIKGFGWLIPKWLPQEEITVIVLRRNPAAIRDSLRRIGCSPFLPAGDQWIITPAAADHHVPLPEEFSFPMARFRLYRLLLRTVMRPGVSRLLTGGRRSAPPFIRRYEAALLDWYIAETDARWRAFEARFPGIQAVEVRLEELNQEAVVEALFDRLGLRPAKTLADVVGKSANLKLRRGDESSSESAI